MRFHIEGRYTRGSSRGPWVIDAPSAEAARRQAENLGIVVASVRADEPPYQAESGPGCAGRRRVTARPTCHLCGRQALAVCPRCQMPYCPAHGRGRCQVCRGRYRRLKAVVGVAALTFPILLGLALVRSLAEHGLAGLDSFPLCAGLPALLSGWLGYRLVADVVASLRGGGAGQALPPQGAPPSVGLPEAPASAAKPCPQCGSRPDPTNGESSETVCASCSYRFDPAAVPDDYASPPLYEVGQLRLSPVAEERISPQWLSVLDLPAPREVLRGRSARWGAALLIYLGGIILSLVMIGLWSWSYRARDREMSKESQETMMVAFVGGLVATHQLARRVLARRARDLKSPDLTRKPVLLLRSFTDDLKKLGETQGVIGPWRRAITLEETLVEEFGRAGPVIVIGRPGELIPPRGGNRLWLKDEAWPQAVELLLAESQYVVMIMGRTTADRGLAWEVRQIASCGCLGKLILVMPPVREVEARARWWKFRELLGWKLPPYLPGVVYLRGREDGSWDAVRHEGSARQLKSYRGRVSAW